MLTHVNRLLGGLPNVRLIAPQGYRNFVALMARCKLVLTDSGGVQEEAPSLGKPVLVMRDTTERPEGVTAGTALLTGPNASAIVEHAVRLLTDEAAYRSDGDRAKSLWRRPCRRPDPRAHAPLLCRRYGSDGDLARLAAGIDGIGEVILRLHRTGVTAGRHDFSENRLQQYTRLRWHQRMKT